MLLKSAIFIDGANFKGNLRNFSFTSHLSAGNQRYRLEERHFDWRSFFDGVIEKFNAQTGWVHRLVRVHWYYPEGISPWVSNASHQHFLAQRIIQEYPGVTGLTPKAVIDLAHRWYRNERNQFERLREETFENIQRRTDFLEFKYVGQYQVHPFRVHSMEQDADGQIFYRGRRIGEKGVDIGIAVDMIAKMPYYDAAILISGDADFLPVVGYLKDHLKHVYQFSVAKGVPPSIRYLSPYLRGKVDCFAFYDELELLRDYLDRSSRIPPDILDSIDLRICQLSQT